MATMSFRSALLLILIGYGVVGEIPWTEDLLISVDECKITMGLIVGDRCFVEYSTIQPGNTAESGTDLLITSHECKFVAGVKVDDRGRDRCLINPLTVYQNRDRCPHLHLKTASGCVGPYSGASCTFQNGLKVDDLCVIINKAPEVEAKPEPKVPQYMPENAVIIPNSTYQKDSYNGFKPLTKSENYYVQSVCGQATAPQARIVNGEIATKGQFPWAIDLGSCSGVLISPRHVLTASHCFMHGLPDRCKTRWSDKSIINQPVRYGGICRNKKDNHCPNGTDMKTARINRVIYAHGTAPKCVEFNDVAIVQLNEDVEFNDYVKPICLSKLAHDNLINVKSVGFGVVKPHHASNVLRYFKTNITFIDSSMREVYTSSPESSACNGDSGGPVQASFNGSSRTYSAGIHSRVNGCTGKSTAFNMFVPTFVDWVCRQTGVCELS